MAATVTPGTCLDRILAAYSAQWEISQRAGKYTATERRGRRPREFAETHPEVLESHLWNARCSDVNSAVGARH